MMEVSIITPSKKIYSGSCYQVNMPGVEGVLGVLFGHMNMVTDLSPGIVEIFNSAGDTTCQKIAVLGAFAEITHTSCVILAQEASFADSYTENELSNMLNECESLKLTHEADSIQYRELENKIEYLSALKACLS